jgi:hypothetical protein
MIDKIIDDGNGVPGLERPFGLSTWREKANPFRRREPSSVTATRRLINGLG